VEIKKRVPTVGPQTPHIGTGNAYVDLNEGCTMILISMFDHVIINNIEEILKKAHMQVYRLRNLMAKN